jgi:hypothetical protein
VEVVEACFFSINFDLRGFDAPDASGSSTKYEPRTTKVIGTEQLPADLMALANATGLDADREDDVLTMLTF